MLVNRDPSQKTKQKRKKEKTLKKISIPQRKGERTTKSKTGELATLKTDHQFVANEQTGKP